MDLREIKWHDMHWIDLAEDRDRWRAHVSTVINLRITLNAEKLFSRCTIGDF
jgi:hypothetical protein